MRSTQSCYAGGSAKFFRLSLAKDSLEDYYRTNFSLMQHHKYSLTELENMMPWEREVYNSMLINYIREENEKLKQKQQR
jgi:hypothetical protein